MKDRDINWDSYDNPPEDYRAQRIWDKVTDFDIVTLVKKARRYKLIPDDEEFEAHHEAVENLRDQVYEAMYWTDDE